MWQVSSNKSVINKTALRIRDIQAGHFAEAEHSTKNSESHKKDIVLPRRGLSLSLSHTRTNLLIYKEINKRKKTLHHSDLVHYRQLTIPSFLFFFLCTKFREAHRSRRHCNTGPMLEADGASSFSDFPF